MYYKWNTMKRAEELLRQVGVEDVKLSDYELCIAANIVDTLTINMTWDDIGGLDSVIEEIKESVILPFRERQLFSDSVLLQPPKGVLLYGPPGCGKTMLAKATAKATGAKFINLQVSSLVDKWYGESQKRAEAVFSLAMKLQPTIIFIDEIDSFLRSRSSNDHEATAMIKTQFMSFWDGLITDPKCHVMIMGATNRPKDVDAAILRRMPCMFHVGLPGKAQREKILKIIMQKEKIGDDVNFSQLAEATEEFSGSDLRETCRIAAINRIREYLVSRENSVDQSHRQAEDRQITMSDLTLAVGKMRQTKLSAIRAPMPIEAD
ncbi:outer mitochondrial transmembrane helix translocase-like isoform X2 [Liolophura sinensis]|uniref:outer mitochondrial transmembrane helix translocase-like isoform X2 n=1 Tax=Liolophura sinensis TaxID=3198878 RepID=UPI0031588E69